MTVGRWSALAVAACLWSGLTTAQTVAPAAPEIGEIETVQVNQPEQATTTVPDLAENDGNWEAAPDEALSIVHVDMVIEGSVVSVRKRETPLQSNGDVVAPLFNLSDIAPALESRVELLDTLLGYHRKQDAMLMSINMADGKVRSNKVVLGKLPGFEPRLVADPWIPLNAVAVLTGTHVGKDDQGRVTLTLDDRLRPQFGLEVWVENRPLETFENEPRTIGRVLLLPLREIVEALGHDLTEMGGVISVLRIQDQARIDLDLATGLVTVNGTPRGVSPDIQFAEVDTLLLPSTAVETLTGTHIKLKPGSSRVDVTLDTRLSSTIAPGERIDAEISSAPLTIEALSYALSDRGPVTVQLTGHVRAYNFTGRLETAGGLQNFADEQQPAWASVDVTALSGWQASVGDYGNAFRETSSVAVGRLRGASWRSQTESGALLAVAAGVPLTGAREIDDQVRVPTFDGFAAGARLRSKDGLTDMSVAGRLLEDGETGFAIASAQKSFDIPQDRETGLRAAFVAADFGVFQDTGQTSVDLRAQGNLSYALNDQTGIGLSAGYEGGQFQSTSNASSSFEGVFDQRVGARTNLSGNIRWNSRESWG
ncbi:MAG: hypothetical protein AAGF20_08305, partial [Pseudomonadota bacterium]